MKTVRKTFKYLMLILLAGGITGGVYVYKLLMRFDIELRKNIQTKVEELAPGWEIDFGHCSFDLLSRVYVENVRIRIPGDETPLTTLPEIILNIDRAALADHQQVIVQKLRLVKPHVQLSRGPDGVWNWQGLPRLPKSDKSLPECEIEQGVVRLHLEHPDGRPPVDLVLQNVNCRLIPSGKRRFHVAGETRLAQIGNLRYSGEWDVDRKTVSLDGGIKELTFGKEFLELAAGVSNQVGSQLFALDERLQRLLQKPRSPGNPRAPFAFASQSSVIANAPVNETTVPPYDPSTGQVMVPEFGLNAIIDVDFHIALPMSAANVGDQLTVRILRGELANPLLPFPLQGLQGELQIDRTDLQLKELTASSGATRVEVSGRLAHQDPARPGEVNVRLTGVPLDDKLRNRLPESLVKMYDMHQPSGYCDFDVALERNKNRRWKTRSLKITARNVSVIQEKFPYPIDAITGTIEQRVGEESDPLVLDFNLQGRAGRRKVTLDGWVRNPGPEGESLFNVRGQEIPIDDAFLSACQAYPPVLNSINALDLKGAAHNLHAQLSRPPGLGQKFELTLVTQLQNASIQYKDFPFRIDQLQGWIVCKHGDWKFYKLTGTHGTTRLTGAASFKQRDGQWQLEVGVSATGARFDDALKSALPPKLRAIWDTFSPSGTLNLATRISWAPGSGKPAYFSLPIIEVVGARMVISAFPYPIHDIDATLSYMPTRDAARSDLLKIKSFQGRHNDAQVTSTGHVELLPDGDWKVRLDDLVINDLEPDRVLRRALPEGLRGVVECLKPQQTVNLRGMVNFWGTQNPTDPVTAAWDVETEFTGGSMALGLDFEDLRGNVRARGIWDGKRADIRGNIDFDSATILDYRLQRIQGPFHVDGEELFLGAREALEIDRTAGTPVRIAEKDRVQALAVNGVITLDAYVNLAQEPNYHVKMTMSHGSLEEYARLYLPGTTNVRGVMNGWVDLYGRGESTNTMIGRGQLQISPAALYELPIIVSIFNVLTFVPPEKTAFNYVLADFNIARDRFNFNSIDLVGSAISLRGWGNVGFNGRLELEFYSMLSRTQLPPPFNVLVGEVTKGWVGVSLRGKTNDPEATIKPVPHLDDALRQLLQGFDRRPQQLPPLPTPGNNRSPPRPGR